jgi:hypothetical protein
MEAAKGHSTNIGTNVLRVVLHCRKGGEILLNILQVSELLNMS